MIVNVRGPMGSGKSTLIQQFAEKHNVRRDTETRDILGVKVDERPFDFTTKKGESKPRRLQLWRCDNDLWIPGNYGDKQKRIAGFTGGVARGQGADLMNGPVGREMLDYYVSLGFPHMLYEGKRASGENFSEPTWEEWARKAGIVFLRLDTPAEKCVERVWTRQKQRGKTKSPVQEARTDAETLRLKKREVRDIERSVESLHHRGFPTARLDHENALAELQDLLQWGGYRDGPETAPLIDWSSHFDRHARGWRPSQPTPSYQSSEKPTLG